MSETQTRTRTIASVSEDPIHFNTDNRTVGSKADNNKTYSNRWRSMNMKGMTIRACLIASWFGLSVLPALAQNGIIVPSVGLVLDGGAYGEVEGAISIPIEGINHRGYQP